MHYLVLGIFVAASVLLLLFASPRLWARGGQDQPAPPAPAQVQPPAAKPGGSLLNRAQIVQRLKKLADNPLPKDLNTQGAMCYEQAARPERADYVCPKCGERTLYTRPKIDPDNSLWAADHVDTVLHALPCLRSYTKTLQGVELTLDESQFCKKCSPNVKRPEEILAVRLAGEKEARRVYWSCDDLRLLQIFLSGGDRVENDYGAEHPLKDDLDRLERILGVTRTGGAPKTNPDPDR
jgi:hypothetical protein